MANQEVDISGIGLVTLVKHRRSRSLKISLQPNGTVRVSLPMWAPYRAAIKFAESKRGWIEQHRQQPAILVSGQAIGKAHHLYLIPSARTLKVSARQQDSTLRVQFPATLSASSSEVQSVARKLAVRALRAEAKRLLPSRLHELAARYNFTFKSVQIRQLKARWGSCTHQQDITLNLFLMQLPWELIDYVLVHELCHTKHLHHGPDFWTELERAIPDAKRRRKAMRAHKPAI